jgi:glycosyltransferase involved in cell wall biosynthesis
MQPLKDGGSRERLRRNLGIAATDRVLIFFGRLDSMKRPIETVRLLAGIKDPRLKLVVVGPDGDVSGKQLMRIAARKRWDGLRVVGPCFGDAKYDYLRMADAYISLSHRENFNFTAAEAMMCGLPPILSEGNDLGWEFAAEGFSWQLRTMDPVEAESAVRSFLLTPGERLDAMGRAAANWVTAHLNPSIFHKKLSAIVKECVNGRGKGHPGTS